MDNLVWRFRARVVACFYVFLSIVAVVGVVRRTIWLLFLMLHFINEASFWIWIWFVLVDVVLLNYLAGLKIWAALKLFCATEDGKAAVEAYAKSLIWLQANVTILAIGVLFVMPCIFGSSGTTETIILIITFILVYGIYFFMMFIVFKFMRELEIVANYSDSVNRANNLDCVYVK